METTRANHPCFNKDSAGTCGRVHLPVAPKCNILCNYCNRKYDCQNESRPGVTSAVLSPMQAINYLGDVIAKMPQITVVGIAGPGDPFANPVETLKTIRLIKERYPHLLICLSSNGLGLSPYLDEVAELGVTHMTITVNAVDPAIGQRFYRWVRDGKVLYSGLPAAELMLERQLQAIRGLKERGITVKVNTIVTPGMNDHHVEDIARTMAGLNVDILNLIPLHPTADTAFAILPEPNKDFMEALRSQAEVFLPQMRHCKRCRADAVGLLSADQSLSMAGCLISHAKSRPLAHPERLNVAVASNEGILVNRHLGESTVFQIWTQRADGFVHIEDRPAPKPGGGGQRWYDLAETLHDCRAVLVSGIGDTPQAILSEEGVTPVVMDGLIDQGLKAVFAGDDLSALSRRKAKVCSGGCGSGGGDGCG